MHAEIRTYSGDGAKAFFDLLEQRKSEVENLMRAVKGFVGYSLVRTAEGGFSVTINQDKAGADASLAAARDWTQRNAANTGVASPKISDGTVILHLR